MSTLTTTLASPSDERSSIPVPPERQGWLRQARNACLRVPPLWPLHSFVAVNPFVGLAGRPFTDVCHLMRRVTHEGMLMSAEHFRRQHASGRITVADLEHAIHQAGAAVTVQDLLDWLKNPEPEPVPGLPSLADVATRRQGQAWDKIIEEEVSKWCAAYYDEGQSAWLMPWKKLPLYAAWREAARIDLTPELAGLKNFRRLVGGLPENAAEAIAMMLEELGLPPEQGEDYLHRLLMTVPGWSSYVQHHVRDRAMRGTHDESLMELLAVRLVFELQLARQLEGSGILREWMEMLQEGGTKPGLQLQKQVLWHCALEAGYQRQLCAGLLRRQEAQERAPGQRDSLQAVFCIDVRSEVMRRSLESMSDRIRTLGFAGFFGMPIEYVPFGRRHGSSQVPVLLSPRYRVREHLPHLTPDEERQVKRRLQIQRRAEHSWNAFKTSAVSCFSFVEAAGLGFAMRLVKDGLLPGLGGGKSKGCPCAEPNLRDFKRGVPDVIDDGQPDSGIPPEEQVQLALGALKNMGLTGGFARLVMLCGHGSRTTNNPYAAGLDCGACGGHAGDSNARVAAAILNRPQVRAGLRAGGIDIPQDTWFIAALHNTTTDAVTLMDADKVPASHEADLVQLGGWLEGAAMRCRQERASGLGLGAADVRELGKLVLERSLDWSQVRPEWGLAGNAAFIAAPRERTRSLSLGGRVFLHEYDHAADGTGGTLELIMTAPLVVASWINLQYYASTVNNRLWGSGTKVTHNVTGTFGIQQGNGGDLKTGLPLQSVHDGREWVHEPLRLSAFIEAPCAAMEPVLARHESVRQLVENGWLHLFAIESGEGCLRQRCRDGSWRVVFSGETSTPRA